MAPDVHERPLVAETDAQLLEIAAELERELESANDTEALLEDIVAFLRRFVVLTDGQLLAIALWLLHTYAFDAADNTPYLNIHSVLMQCGKSRLLAILKLLAHNADTMITPSEAVVYRWIEGLPNPTLLLDEVDAIWSTSTGDNEALRALVNAGYERGGQVPRCVNFTEIQFFNVFCPKALAGIGRLPDTVADRSIPIKLKRKKASEPCERFRKRLPGVSGPAEDICSRAEAWAAPNIDALRAAWPELPDCLSDRQHDCIEPLLAIADLAGGRWPADARAAFVRIFAGARSADDSLRLRCLTDCRDALGAGGDVQSSELVARLQAIEDGPWQEQILTANRLAFLLRDFDVKPLQLRFPDPIGQKRGYRWAEFEDAFLEVAMECSGGQVGRSEKRTTAVNHEQLRVQHGAVFALVGGPAPAADARHLRERPLRAGVGAGTVLACLEHHIDPAAALHRGLEVGGDFGKRVGGVADEQDPLVGGGEQLVEHRGGEALLPDGARAGPDGPGASRVGVPPGGQSGSQGKRDARARQLGARGPRRGEGSDRVAGAWRGSGDDVGDPRRRSGERFEGGGERMHLGVAQALQHGGDGVVDAHADRK
jgi:hypothetical protein